MSSDRTGRPSDVAIGVVGSADLVEQIMLLGAEGPANGWTLVGAGHRREIDARTAVAKIADRVDVVLFAGPLQHDLALADGPLSVPATFVPVERGSLYAGLVRLMSGSAADPTRISIDSLTATDVAAAYDAVGIASSLVQIAPYTGPDSVGGYAEFHVDAFRRGRTTGALTTVPTVCEELLDRDVPAIRLDPSPNTLRLALRTAALLGSVGRLKESQIALLVVDFAAGRPPVHGLSDYRWQEQRLAVHRALIEQARTMQATVHRSDDDGYLITATYGAVSRVTDGLRSAIFVDDLATQLGVALHVGIGLGLTARAADEHARQAIAAARTSEHSTAVVVDAAGVATALPVHEPSERVAARPAHARAEPTRSLRLLAALVDGAVGPGDKPVVDADAAAAALGVSRRSAQRALQALAADGLAWPMPPLAPKQVGRPRQPYRLVVERLAAAPASSSPSGKLSRTGQSGGPRSVGADGDARLD